MAKLLEGYGDRVQKSVFEVRLEDDKQLARLCDELLELIDLEEDSVRLYPLHPSLEAGIKLLGQAESWQDPEVLVI